AITVQPGDMLTWTNLDDAPHDVTTTAAPQALASGELDKGDSWSYTFTAPGTYSYHCSVHPDMTATVTVTDAPAAAPAPVTAPTSASAPASVAARTSAQRQAPPSTPTSVETTVSPSTPEVAGGGAEEVA